MGLARGDVQSDTECMTLGTE